QHGGVIITRVVEHKLGVRHFPTQISPIVKEDPPVARARDSLAELLGYHLVRIDVNTVEGSDETCMLEKGLRAHRLVSNPRTSTKWPSRAAAAAITGLTRCVRLPLPCRPSKLRFEVLAQRAPLSSTSSLIAIHMLQPESRHSNPASRKILSRPSASASSLTHREPGTTRACLTVLAILFPATTRAATRRSSIRELVQEPMKTVSSAMSVIGVPGSRHM